jgi:peptidoglycan/xylan/chitin deacetylase (PgdA/CDA1 family)
VGCAGAGHGKVFNGPRSRKRVALTFDDGPSAYTPQILRILEHHDAHATFFEIGEQVPAYPGYTRAILAQGSELGNHTWRHTIGSSEGMARTSHLIERASGFRPCMFRPPGGELTASQAAEARRLHMAQVIWDVDTRDWSRPGTGAIISRATAVQPGSIVLMHDGGGPREQTVAALPHIIANLKSRGYHLVTLTRLLGGHYRVAEAHGRRAGLRALPDPRPFPANRPGP